MKEEELQYKIACSEGSDKIEAILGYAYFMRQSNLKKSCELAVKAELLAIEFEEKNLELRAIASHSYAYFYHSKFYEAERLADKLLKMGTKADNVNSIGTSYNIKARIAYKLKNMALALEHNLKALEFYLQKPVAVNLMSCYNNLGTCHQQMQNYNEALNYFQLALKEADNIHHPAREVILMNIGTIQYSKEDYHSALQSFLQAKKTFLESNMTKDLVIVDSNIGLAYYKLDRIIEGDRYFQKSYKLSKKINEPEGLSMTCQVIGTALLEKEKVDESYSYLSKALKVAQENNLIGIKLTIYESLAVYWKKKDDYHQVSDCLNQVITLTRELNKEMQQNKLSELEAKYKTEIYKLKAQELDTQNKSMSEQIDKFKVSLQELRKIHRDLEQKFQQAATKINEQDDLLSSQSRMATIGEMVSLIAHQWRQPLNVIGLLVQSFQDAWEFDEMSDEFVDQQVKIVMEQINYMSDTITDFRNFFKSEFIREFELQEVVKKSLLLLDYSLKKSQIEILTEFEDECRFSGNPNDLVQVILNLLNNARDAIEEKNICKPYIRINMKKFNNNIVISVFNSGSHLSEAVKQKLFEPYYTTKGKEGTGIGLYICKMIIENKFHGTIDAQNLDAGVQFTIKLTAECKNSVIY